MKAVGKQFAKQLMDTTPHEDMKKPVIIIIIIIGT
jgi:hypothetical protein